MSGIRKVIDDSMAATIAERRRVIVLAYLAGHITQAEYDELIVTSSIRSH